MSDSPPGIVTMSEWIEEIDPDSGYPYYLNTVTGVSTWERPPEMPQVSLLGMEAPPVEEEAAVQSEAYYDYDKSHLEDADTYGYHGHGQEVDEYGNYVHVDESPVEYEATSMGVVVKPQKKISWVEQFKKNELRPWQCMLCKRPNRSHNPTCVQCGKKKPFRPSLEDLAAKKIQALYRTHAGWKNLKKMLIANYEKLWDPKARVYYYVNKSTKERFSEKPMLLRMNCGEDDDIPLSPRSKKIEEERLFRELGMREREEKFKATRKLEAKEKQDAEDAHWEAQWALSLSEAIRTRELLNCWKNFDRIHDKVLTLTNLTSVRLIGHKLTYIPEAFCDNLLQLKSLSFSNNELVELPVRLGNLTGLTDLNVLKNKLIALPESLCVLTELVKIDLSNNKLESLPVHFGALSSLRGVLTIDENQLTELPMSVGDLAIESICVSRNLVTELPPSISRLSKLKSLVVNGCKLSKFPSEIVDLPHLRHVSLCRNELTDIAPDIGKLVKLENLWLDWNKIRVLPDSIANCTNMKYLKLEGNPMIQPTFDIIAQGTGRIRLWSENRLKFQLNRQRIRIITDLQHMFSLVEELDLIEKVDDMVAVEPAAPHGEEGYYAFVLDNFLPSREAGVDALFPRLQAAVNDAAQNKQHKIRDFPFTEDQVKDALDAISDPLGPVGHADLKLNFRRCSCKKKDGRRKVCIPPARGWSCRRMGCLVKKVIMSDHEYRRQVAKANDKVAMERQIKLASSTAWRFIRSAQGVKAMLQLALAMAANRREANRVDLFVERRMKKALEQDAKQRKRRQRRLKELQERKVRNLNQLTKRREKLLHKKESLRGWELEECEEEIQMLLEKLERSPEDEEISRIKEQDRDAEDELELAKTAARAAAGFKPLTEAQQRRPDAELLKLAHSMLHEATQKYVEEQVTLAKEKVKRESALMAHISAKWSRGDIKMVFEAWREVALEMIEIREYLEERKVEFDEHDTSSAYLQSLLIQMEQEKYVEHWDEYNEVYYYIHSETGERRDQIPVDEAYVPRNLRDDTKTKVGPSWFGKFLKKKEHHELLSGMELVDQNQEYLAMVEQNYQQAGADLQEYINEYDGLPQQ